MIVNNILYATSTQKGHVPLLSYTRITAAWYGLSLVSLKGFFDKKKTPRLAYTIVQ